MIIRNLNKATYKEIYNCLTACDERFVLSLQKKINIEEYSKKIYSKAYNYEAWDKGKLVGIIACYYHNYEGYLTNVSVIKSHVNKGIASDLLEMLILDSKKRSVKKLELEVDPDNKVAINFYKKFNFELKREDEESLFMLLDLV